MARGQIAKPEFYVDYFLWLNTVGSLNYNDLEFDNAFNAENAGAELVSSLLRLDPSTAAAIPTAEYAASVNSFTIPTGMSAGILDDLGNNLESEDTTDFDNWNIDYVAYLNHNFKTAKCFPYVSYKDGNSVETTSCSEIINFNGSNSSTPTDGSAPSFDGYSIASIDNGPSASSFVEKMQFSFHPSSESNSLATTLFLGGLSVGHKYTLPTSPDMNITMKYDVGYKRKETINGRKTAHLNWFRERGWTQFGIKKHSWNLENQISSGSHRFNWRKAGRRSWSITYSYISDDDMFPTNLNLTTQGMDDDIFNGDSSGSLSDNGFDIITANKTLMGDSSLIAQLLQKTCFGYLPFIFRPDNTYAKADGFCLAMIDMKSFSIKQVAHKLWSVKLKIVELL